MYLAWRGCHSHIFCSWWCGIKQSYHRHSWHIASCKICLEILCYFTTSRPKIFHVVFVFSLFRREIRCQGLAYRASPEPTIKSTANLGQCRGMCWDLNRMLVTELSNEFIHDFRVGFKRKPVIVLLLHIFRIIINMIYSVV